MDSDIFTARKLELTPVALFSGMCNKKTFLMEWFIGYTISKIGLDGDP